MAGVKGAIVDHEYESQKRQYDALDEIRRCANHMASRINFINRDSLLHEQRQEPFATALRRFHALYVTVGVLIQRLPADTDDSAPIEMSKRQGLTRRNKNHAKDVMYAGEDAGDVRAVIKRAVADGYMATTSRYYSGHAFALKSLYEALERFFAGPPPRERKRKPKARKPITAATFAGPLNLTVLSGDPGVFLDSQAPPRALLSLDREADRKLETRSCKKAGRPPRRGPPPRCKHDACNTIVDTNRGGGRGLCARHYQQRRRAGSL